MFLFLLFCFVSSIYATCHSVSIFSGYPLSSGYTSLLVNSYTQYLYNMNSRDSVELRVGGTQIIDCMKINNQPELIKELRKVSLDGFSTQSCIPNFYLDQIASDVTLYLIMNKSPCTSQTSEIEALKNRGTRIVPVGFTADVSDNVLLEFASGNITNKDYFRVV